MYGSLTVRVSYSFIVNYCAADQLVTLLGNYIHWSCEMSNLPILARTQCNVEECDMNLFMLPQRSQIRQFHVSRFACSEFSNSNLTVDLTRSVSVPLCLVLPRLLLPVLLDDQHSKPAEARL